MILFFPNFSTEGANMQKLFKQLNFFISVVNYENKNYENIYRLIFPQIFSF